MKTYRALLVAAACALLGTPAFAQEGHGHDLATAAPTFGPAMMNDMRSAMQTMMSDPVISKRMHELMAKNPAFKAHVERMRSLMPAGGAMMGGSGMMGGANGNGPMMSATASPKP
jgi:hypothetical protein